MYCGVWCQEEMLSKINNFLKLSLAFPTKGVAAIDTAFSFLTAIIVGFLILFLMLFVTIEVVARYAFKPTPGHVELVRLIMPVIAFLGVAYAQSYNGHIRVEILLLKIKGRLYHFIESFYLVLALIVFVLLAINTLDNALFAREMGDVTPFYLFPTWETRVFIFIGCAAMCLRLIIQLTQNLIQLASGVERRELNQSKIGA